MVREAIDGKLFPSLTFRPDVPLKVEFAELVEEEKPSTPRILHMKDVSVKETSVVEVPGLIYFDNFVTEEEEKRLIAEVRTAPYRCLDLYLWPPSRREIIFMINAG